MIGSMGAFVTRRGIDAVYMLLGYADLEEMVVKGMWSMIFPVLDARRRKGDPY